MSEKFPQKKEDEMVPFPKEQGDGRVLMPDEVREEREKNLTEERWREQE